MKSADINYCFKGIFVSEVVGFEKPNANTINVSMLTDKQKNLLKLFLEEL